MSYLLESFRPDIRSNPLLHLPEEFRFQFFKSQARQHLLLPDDRYPNVDYRTMEDYCRLAQVAPADIYKLGHPQEVSKRLKRPMRIGDIGCGRGCAIFPYHNKEGVIAVGIDRRVKNIQIGNTNLFCDDFFNFGSEFWKHTYDFLFSIMSAQYTRMPLSKMVNLMREGLAEKGKGYLVVPTYQRFNFRYEADLSDIDRKNVKVIAPVDNDGNQCGYVSLQFGR